MEYPSAYQGQDPYVFVCYAHDDADAVYAEIAWLQAEGVNVWYDEGISLGTEWTEALADAIEGCEKFIFFVTPNCVTRENCRRELNFAQEEGREVIAVHLQATEVPGGLRLSLNNRQAIFKHELADAHYRRELLQTILGVTPESTPEAVTYSSVLRIRLVAFAAAALVIAAAGTWWFNADVEETVEPKATVKVGPVDEDGTGVLRNSIAVLPFDNLSPDPDNAYFAAGIHEEVINQLVGIRDLSVISRTSVMRYVGVHKPIEEIAKELGVAAVMEGSVRYAGNRVRIMTQLIDGRSGAHLWSKAYEDSLEDIFGIQLAIATEIASTMEADFSHSEQVRIGTRTTENPEAYASFLRATSAWGNYSPTGPLHEALDNAIDLDPQFAEALAFKAFVHSVEATAGRVFFQEFGRDDQQRFVSLSVEYANRALAIDSQQARAHYALRWAHTLNREWESSQQSAARAYELSPNDYIVLNSAGWDALARGATDQAIELMERSMAIAPGDFANQDNFTVLLRYTRRWDNAERQARLVTKLVPDAASAYLNLAEILAYAGDLEGARGYAKIAETKQPSESTLSSIALIYRRLGEVGVAERLFNHRHPAKAPISANPVIQYNWHAALGNTQAAIEQLEKALNQGFPWGVGRDLHYHSTQPHFDAVRAHPKFDELVRRAALPLTISE